MEFFQVFPGLCKPGILQQYLPGFKIGDPGFEARLIIIFPSDVLLKKQGRMGRVKMGTDMAVSDEHFLDMMNFYRKELTQSGLAYVMFGHIGDNHLHINLLPEQEQTALAEKTHRILLDQVLKWGGTVSAEHGIGKLKKDYYLQMVGPEAIQELRVVKKALDPEEKLGSGNLL